MNEIRCPHCNRKILEDADGKVVFRCPKCKKVTIVDTKELVPVN